MWMQPSRRRPAGQCRKATSAVVRAWFATASQAGIGTSSRKLDASEGGYAVGVLVECNCGTAGNYVLVDYWWLRR
jgi:hypothetical protein